MAGNVPQVSDTPANANPLAAGLKLKMDEVAEPKAVKSAKPLPKPPQARLPTASDLSKEYEKLKLGIDPRQARQSEDLSEGGMGNQMKAGTEDGIPGLSAAAGQPRLHARRPQLSWQYP